MGSNEQTGEMAAKGSEGTAESRGRIGSATTECANDVPRERDEVGAFIRLYPLIRGIRDIRGQTGLPARQSDNLDHGLHGWRG